MSGSARVDKLELLVQQCYDGIRSGNVSATVYDCMRLAKLINDPFSFGFFVMLQEKAPQEGGRALLRAFPALEREAARGIIDNALERALLFFKLRKTEAEALEAPKDALLFIGSNLIDSEIDRCKTELNTLSLPQGMNEYDISIYYPILMKQKSVISLRASALERIKASVRHLTQDS